MKKFKSRKRLMALFLCMLLLIGSVPTFAAEMQEEGQAVEGQSASVDTTYGVPENSPEKDAEQKPTEEETEEETQEIQDAEGQESRIPAAEEEQSEEAGPPAEPLRVALQTGRSQVAPEHHKYIKDNGDGIYTLTLNVKGMYDSTVNKPKLDVLLIVDISNSMNNNYGSSWTTRLKTVKDIVTGPSGLSDAILGNQDIIGRMAVVSYSGSQGSRDNPDVPWNDAATTQTWTSSKETLDASVLELSTNGGTNCQAGLYEGARVLASSAGDAQKAVIFLSDGQPTYYYDSAGKTQGTGNSDDNGFCAGAAYRQAGAISGLSGFYTVGITADVSVNFLTTLANSSHAANKAAYSAATAADLAAVFKKITANITEYTCRDITITDVLSDYVQIPASGADGKIVKIDGKGRETDITDTVRLNINGKTVTADFPDQDILDKESTYSLSFIVEPTRKAYDEYADTLYGDPSGSGYPHTGSGGSDAPGNHTSSGHPGFYSNTSATLKYTYGTEGASSDTVIYTEKPVVQVSDQEIPVTKCWEEVPMGTEKPEVTVNLYQDKKEEVYRTLTIRSENDKNTWTEKFRHVAKGHEYHIKEVQLSGYQPPLVEGDSKKGFKITNIYDLTAVTVRKVWNDHENADGKRPDSIRVQLKKNGVSEGPPVTLGQEQENTVIDGNTWIYTWKDLPKTDRTGEIQYTVEEVTQSPDYEAAYSEDTLTITNTRKPSLKITKTVAGDMGDKTKKFRFTVVLKKADGEALSGDYSYIRMNGEDVQPTDGTLTFNREGAAEFALGHKESLTILNLPVGTVYEIKENAEDSAGYEVTCNAADHGTLFNSKQEVAVTNTRNIIPETGLDDRKDGVLPAAVSLFMAFVGTMFLTSRRRRGSL